MPFKILKFDINLNVLIFLYIVTSSLWVWFFYKADFNSFDWIGSRQIIFDVLYQSIQQMKIPYHYAGYDVPFKDFTNGSYAVRWFAMGAGSISPQNILFAYFDQPFSIYLNFFFYVSLSYYGIYLWSKKFNLSPFALIWLTTSWVFNGALVSRWGVGHIAYSNGYLLIPIFLYLINELIENNNNKFNIKLFLCIKMIVFLFFCKLNSNGHIIFQMYLIYGIVALFFLRLLKFYLLTLVVSIPLFAFYIFPMKYSPYLLKGSIYSSREIFGGYGIFPISDENYCFNLLKLSDKYDILNHAFNIILHIFEGLTKIITPSCDASWESSIYIGYSGLFILIISVICIIRCNYKFSNNLFKILLISSLVFLLSTSLIFKYLSVLTSYVYDFPKIDRLPTRLMLYPLFFLLLISSLGISRMKGRNLILIKILFTFQIIEIILFFKEWTLRKVSQSYIPPVDEERLFPFGRILDFQWDTSYINTVNFSILVSFVTFLLLLFTYFYIKKLK
jgi:hypothetical protein